MPISLVVRIGLRRCSTMALPPGSAGFGAAGIGVVRLTGADVAPLAAMGVTLPRGAGVVLLAGVGFGLSAGAALLVEAGAAQAGVGVFVGGISLVEQRRPHSRQ